MYIARVSRVRGIRGEVAAIPYGNHPERYAGLKEVFLFSRETGLDGRRFEIDRLWQHADRLILKFKGIDSISEAERLRGAEVCIPLASRPALPPGEHYQSDLVGYSVVDRQTGETLGRVSGWRSFGEQDLLTVESGETGKEVLIPFVKTICVDIDPAKGEIRVDLPEGLKELNQ